METDFLGIDPNQYSQIPEDLLAEQIRNFLIESVSKTGGHIGANLGTVELTIALHRKFNFGPELSMDNLFFDTGHQAYTHKILTGRSKEFSSLNSNGGLSRFASRQESQNDLIEASHAGTAISIASGFSRRKYLDGILSNTVVIVGDGTLSEGMTLEALVELSSNKGKLIIILNDNDMAIAPTVGAFSRSNQKNMRIESFTKAMGIYYLGPFDGHLFGSLYEGIELAKEVNSHVLLHIKTEKGRGLELSRGHPYAMHFSIPFDPKTGEGASPTLKDYTLGHSAASTLSNLLKEYDDMFVITPATPYASFLDSLISEFPARVLDVGMSEQHALGLSVGLSLAGSRVAVCIQSTFLQRAYDQLIHDIAYMNVPVLVVVNRSGFSGLDSPTHHGLFDMVLFRNIPNLNFLAPVSQEDVDDSIRLHMKNLDSPTVLILPYFPTEDSLMKTICLDFADDNEMRKVNEVDCLILCTVGSIELADKIRFDVENSTNNKCKIMLIKNLKNPPFEKLSAIAIKVLVLVFDYYDSCFLEDLNGLTKSQSTTPTVLRYNPRVEFAKAGSLDFSRASVFPPYNLFVGNLIGELAKTRNVD